jgi:hypothetical protein
VLSSELALRHHRYVRAVLGRAAPVGRGGAMKRIWPIIGVAKVAESFKWCRSLLGLPEATPAHGQSSTLMEGVAVSPQVGWAHEHPSLTNPDHAKPSNGLLLFFEVDNFDMALPRARPLEKEPHVNSSTGTLEFRSVILMAIT